MITHYTDNRFSLIPVVTGSSISRADLNNRHGGRIKQPQTATHIGKYTPHSRTPAPCWWSLSVLGAWIGSQRKSPLCAFLCARRFAATRSALRHHDIGTFIMIYTFLIAQKGQKLADLGRTRTISCHAKNLSEARSALSGLPLALISHTPAKGGEL